MRNKASTKRMMAPNVPGMATMDRPELLRALLRGPCQVTNVERKRFARGHATADEVIVTHRLILLLDGRLDYTVEGETRRVAAGSWFWVPAWARREWKVAAREGCELAWCEFATDPVTVEPGLYLAADGVAADVEKTLARMATWWPARGAADELRLEAAAKSLAAMFWPDAERAGGGLGAGGERHAEVRRATAWLEANFARADALDAFYRTLTLSPNHFRLLFRRQTGETVQAMLTRLRLRRARYLVTETARSVKEIAAESGYDDP
jgi:AraC-like DNA-binding protein